MLHQFCTYFDMAPIISQEVFIFNNTSENFLLQFILNIIPVIFTGLTLFVTLKKYYKESTDIARANIAKDMYQIELLLAKNNSCLRFHNITQEDLDEYNITSDEFAYLVANFTIIRSYYGVSSLKKDIFQSDSYLDTMLHSKDVDDAWPLIRKMFGNSSFIQKVEERLREIHADIPRQ